MDKEEIDQDWAKLERNARKTGMSQGLSDGRDNNFQKFFDEGYLEGFSTAFKAAQYKGSIFAKSQIEGAKVDEDPLLETPERGFCCVCDDKSLLEKTKSQIKQEQDLVTKSNLEKLSSLYPGSITEPG